MTSPLSKSISLQRRILRRMTFVLAAVLILGTGLLVLIFRSDAQTRIEENGLFALTTLSNTAEQTLNIARTDLSNLADSQVMRNFARELLAELTTNDPFDETLELEIQADILRLLESTITRRSQDYLELRYIMRDGFIHGEVLNQDGVTTLIPEARRATGLDDEAYEAIRLIEESGTVTISPVIPPADADSPATIRLYAPVTLRDESDIRLGVLQLVLNAEAVNRALATALPTSISETGRTYLLLDNNDQVVVSTAGWEPSQLVLDEATVEDPEEVIDTAQYLRLYTRTLNTPTDWQIVVVDDLGTLEGAVDRISIVVVVIATLLMIAILIMLNRLLQPLLAPLDQVSAVAEQLAKGQTITPEQSRATQHNEIHDVLGSLGGISDNIAQLQAELANQNRRYSRDLEIASRIGREIATLRDTDTLVNRAINRICDEFGFYHAQVFLVDDIGMNAVLRYSRGRPGEQLLSQNYKISVGSDSVVGRAAGTAQPVIVNDTITPNKANPHLHNPFLPDTRAEMALPLLIGDRVTGVLDVQSRQPFAFKDEDLPTFTLLADQLSVAIYNSQLVNQANTRMEQIERLNRRLSGEGWETSDPSHEQLHAYRYNLLNIEQAANGAPQDANNGTDYRIEPTTEPTRNGHGKGLSSPITVRGQVVGMLNAQPVPGQEFSEVDEIVVQSVAERVALAVDNARLFQETQVRFSETSRLYELTRALNEANAMDGIINAIHQTVMPEAGGGQIWLFEEYVQPDAPLWLELDTDVALKPRLNNDDLVKLRLHMPAHPILQDLGQNQILLINDIEQDTRLTDTLRHVFQRMDARSAVLIPLNARGIWRGVIMMEFDQPRNFSEQEGRIYMALIDQAGVAVENRLLLLTTEEEVARNENLYAASRIISTARNMQDLVRAAVSTNANPAISFSLSLLEGKLDASGWPTTGRIVAESNGMDIAEHNETYELLIPPDSPMRTTREPVMVVDIDPLDDNVSETVRMIRRQGYRFVAYFPLFNEEQPIAIFEVRSSELHEMSTNDQESYRALTGQMSSQIQIRNLLSDTRARLDETHRLYTASSAITRAQDITGVYETAVEHLAGPLALDQATGREVQISILRAQPEPEPDAPYLEYVTHWMIDRGVVADMQGQRLDSADYPYGRLLTLADGNLLHFDNLIESHDRDPLLIAEADWCERMMAANVNCLLVAPVRSRQRWYGVILCQSNLPATFNEQYSRFVNSIAEQVGTAVDNLILFDEARFEADRAQSEADRALTLAQAAQLTSRIREDDFKTGLAGAFEKIATDAGFDRWMLMFLDQRTGKLGYQGRITVNVPGLNNETLVGYDTSEDSPDHGIPFVDVIHLNRMLTVNDPFSYPDFAIPGRHRLAAHFGKHIALPVRLGGRPVGAMFIGRSLEAEDLGEGDEQLAITLASQVETAWDNRQLFLSVRTQQRRLNAILATMPVGVIVLNPQTMTPEEFNEQAQIYLRQEIDPTQPFTLERYNIYRAGTEMTYPEDEMPIFNVSADYQPLPAEDVAVITDDYYIDLLVNAAPILDENGDLLAIVTTFQDISNIRNLENWLQDNLRETTALSDTQIALTEASEAEDVMYVVLEQLPLLQASDGYIFVLDSDSRLHNAAYMLEAWDDEVPQDIFSRGEIVFIEDVHTYDAISPEAVQQLQARGINSLVTVPLRITSERDQRILGWLVFVADSQLAYTNTTQDTLRQLGEITSAALDNRYLIRQQEAIVRDLRALYASTANISRAENITALSQVLRDALLEVNSDYAACHINPSVPISVASRDVVYVDQHEAQPIDFGAVLQGYPIPQEGIYLNDLRSLTNPNEVEQQLIDLGLASIAVIGLHLKDHPQGGFILVAYTDPHRFTDSEDGYLNTLADSTSIVLNNFMLFEQTEASLEETALLYQASKSLADSATPEDIVDVVKNYLLNDHFNQTFVALLSTPKWDSPNASIDIVASWNRDETIDLRGVSMARDQFPAWDLLADRDSLLMINDVREDESLSMIERVGLESLDARSLIVVPLRVRNRNIGLVWIGSQEPYEHTERDRRTYAAFAEQASLSMEAAYLLEQTERRAAQLETSAAVSKDAGRLTDVQDLMNSVVDLIKASFGYDQVQIFLMDDEDEWALLKASTGEPGQQLLDVGHKLRRGSASVIGQVTLQGTPQIALDTADANVVHQPNPYLPLTRSELALPLIIGGKVVGALDVQSNQPNAFTEGDVTALTTLAAQISVALDNADLYAGIQQQARNTAFLFQVTRNAAAAETLEDAMRDVAAQLYIELQDTYHIVAVGIYLKHTYMDAQETLHHYLKMMALQGSGQPLSEVEDLDLGAEKAFIASITDTLSPYIINQITPQTDYLPVASSARSAVLLPMSSSNELIGLITLESAVSNAIDESNMPLLQTLTGSLSAITQSFRLLEELRDTNERLQELDQLKSDFLANMSHELRTPLNSIIGFSRVMLKGIDGPLTEMQEQDLTTIYDSGQHLLMLINSILDQAKIAAGKLDMKYDYFDMKPLAEAIKSIGIGLVKDKDISIVLEVAQNLSKAYGDEFRTRQVMLNLVSNAAKFTDQGTITIRVYPVQDEATGRTMIQVDVEDTGIGIEQKNIRKLFEAFQQVDSSLTRTQGGTGLGLPIAKSLVELQGGWMRVESEVNVGSVFSFTLPTQQSDAENILDKIFDNPDNVLEDLPEEDGQTEEDRPSTRPTQTMEVRSIMQNAPNMPRRRQILLIEDNKDMVDQFRRTLQLEGYEVQTADHPTYAEAMASNLRPTLIIMDVNFANGQGWDILRSLKQRDETFDIPVIVVTLSGEADRAYDLGAHAFIQRPFIPEDLVVAARSAERDSDTRRILIIDDAPEDVRLLTQLLTERGHYRVFSASSGKEGISMVARRAPDLIILDLRMPEMDGFAVLQELRSHRETQEIPVMIVTGELGLSADEQALLGNLRVLPKTDLSQAEYEHLIADIRSHLRR